MKALRPKRRSALLMVAATALAGAAGLPAVAAAATPAKGTVITTEDGPFGPMLVVGSGHYAGYTLYMLSSDYGTNYGCTSVIIKTLPGGPGSCAGPSSDPKAEWPAITTNGPPVAGSGVTAALLGSVTRPGIGDEVTYAGHPLYLFDTMAGAVTGEDWDEPSLPPWHGIWYLVSPNGNPLAWPGTLATTTIGHKTVLAALMLTGIGWVKFPVYSYSKDTSSTSACTAACAAGWPPLLTEGSPGVIAPVSTSSTKTLTRPDGTLQLTYKGKPLYLFGYEGIAPQGVTYAATGSGAGAKVDGGTFNLVTP